MAVSTVIFFGLVLFCIIDVHADANLSALETRLLVVEGEILARKRTALNSDITLNNKFKVLKSSLKKELTESSIPPLIKPLVKQAIADILDQDYIRNVISGHVLDEVHSLKVNAQNTKTQLKAITQDLRHIERERDTYRKSLGKLRRRLTKDILATQLQLKQTEADLHDARILKSGLRQTNHELSDTQQNINGLLEDFITLNTSCVMVKQKVESCTDGLQEIQLKLPRELQSLAAQMNQTNEDLLNTRKVITGLTEDLMTLNISCGMRKDIEPSGGNSLTTLPLPQMPLTTSTTTHPGTTASTDPIQDPSQTVPLVPGTTQDSDQQGSTDPSQDRTPSRTVPPVTVTTQDPDQHATPSPATGDDLLDASRDGDLETVRRILSEGHVDIDYRGWWNRTPLLDAAWNGRRDVLEFLVGKGADVSLVDEEGDNVLHAASGGGHLETVRLVLSLDVVDINARNNDGRTAAFWARYFGHQQVLDLLVSRGAH